MKTPKHALLAGELWQNHGLVFCTAVGTPLAAGNVRRTFKKITKAAGLGEDWTPRELRTSFVSLMSDSGVPVDLRVVQRFEAVGQIPLQISGDLRQFLFGRGAFDVVEQRGHQLAAERDVPRLVLVVDPVDGPP